MLVILKKELLSLYKRKINLTCFVQCFLIIILIIEIIMKNN